MARYTPLCLIVLLAIFLTAAASAAPVRLASSGKTRFVVVVDPDALAAEKHAAEELAAFLKQVTGADFPVKTTTDTPSGPLLLVGPGRVAREVAPNVSMEGLTPDGIVIETVGE
ncbi:MAG: hypothetical protein ACYC4B_18810, partial [Pirellulaceae bacterium]